MSARFALFTFVLILSAVGVLTQIPAAGYTRIELAEEGPGRAIFAAVLREGAPVVLVWRNSLFDLDVTEEFEARDGRLVQRKVTFSDPRGLPPPQVAPADVVDLYHTGGPFTASGLSVPVARVVYRVSAAGNPRMKIGDRVIDFKQEVGFGGAVVLKTRAARLYEIFF